MQLRGSQIPAADILITTKPNLDALHGERLDSVLKLSQLAAENAAAAKVAARHMDVDPDDLNEILAAASAPPMGAPVTPPPGPPPPPVPGPQGPTPEMTLA